MKQSRAEAVSVYQGSQCFREWNTLKLFLYSSVPLQERSDAVRTTTDRAATSMAFCETGRLHIQSSFNYMYCFEIGRLFYFKLTTA